LLLTRLAESKAHDFSNARPPVSERGLFCFQPTRRFLMKKRFAALAALFLLPVSVSLACGIEGQATRTDGSKVDGTARVSTDWNGNNAYPRDGYYNLDLGGGACGKSVEVFVNGNSIGKRALPNSGNARVDFTLRGGSDMPVR
jgi:hypothetical protein